MACMCFGAAASIFFMASSLSPNDPAVASTLARLAEAYMGLGDFENAVEHAERAMTKQTRGGCGLIRRLLPLVLMSGGSKMPKVGFENSWKGFHI